MNPYEQLQGSNPILIPQTQIDEVNGEAGARSLPMGVNSGRLALDSTNAILWVIKTDNVGNKTVVAPFDLTPHVPEPDPAIKALDDRMSKMESQFGAILDKLSSLEEIMK